MRVLQIVHQSDSAAGVFLDVLGADGVELVTWEPAGNSEPPAAPDSFDAILSFGGGVNPDQGNEHPWLFAEQRFLKQALRDKVPLLGVCLGAELIAVAAGSPPRKSLGGEIGWYEVKLTAAAAGDPILGALPQRFEALEWHAYEVVLPDGATELARSRDCVQAYRIGYHAWAIQFHAEVTAADFHRWVAEDGTSEEAVALGVDPLELAVQTDERIEDWNELGRGLCSRFLAVAGGR